MTQDFKEQECWNLGQDKLANRLIQATVVNSQYLKKEVYQAKAYTLGYYALVLLHTCLGKCKVIVLQNQNIKD